MAVLLEPISFILEADMKNVKLLPGQRAQGGRVSLFPAKAEIMRILWSASHSSLSRTQ